MAEARYMSNDELNSLPVGSVIMTVTEPESFGLYEQRIWEKFGGVQEWQFGMPRHEWQSTDGGFVRVGNDPLFDNRKIVILFEATEDTERAIRGAHEAFRAVRRRIDG
jgi:hypothetical protein